MKKLFFILKQGLKNPRFYIEGINLKWKHLSFLPLFLTILMGLNFSRFFLPTFKAMQNDIRESIVYLPDFQTQEGHLKIKSNEKALHYQSEHFQLIIDDQMDNLAKENGLILEADADHPLNLDSTINLLLLRNQTVIYLPINDQVLVSNYDAVSDKQTFASILNYFGQFHRYQILLLFLVTWLSSNVIYLYFLIITAVLTGILNMRLNFPLPFSIRLKLVMICSFVPLLLVEIIKILLPVFYIPLYLMIALTLFIIYHTFKQHTLFMHQLLSHMDIISLDNEEDDGSDKK